MKTLKRKLRDIEEMESKLQEQKKALGELRLAVEKAKELSSEMERASKRIQVLAQEARDLGEASKTLRNSIQLPRQTPSPQDLLPTTLPPLTLPPLTCQALRVHQVNRLSQTRKPTNTARSTCYRSVLLLAASLFHLTRPRKTSCDTPSGMVYKPCPAGKQ